MIELIFRAIFYFSLILSYSLYGEKPHGAIVSETVDSPPIQINRLSDPASQEPNALPPINSKKQLCHLRCGPNDLQYEVHYDCKENEGYIFESGVLLAIIRHCVGSPTTQIRCEDDSIRARFQIIGVPFANAEGRYNEIALTNLQCKNEPI